MSGPLVGHALKAAATLEARGISVTVINNAFVNRPDIETIGGALARNRGRLVTVEDHQLIGGMSSQLTHALAIAGISFQLKALGVQGEFGQSAYLADELYRKHELDAEAIVNAVLKFEPDLQA